MLIELLSFRTKPAGGQAALAPARWLIKWMQWAGMQTSAGTTHVWADLRRRSLAERTSNDYNHLFFCASSLLFGASDGRERAQAARSLRLQPVRCAVCAQQLH